MQNIQSVLRWLTHKVSLAVLANAVAVAIPLYAFSVHVTDSGVVKRWLSETNSYETVINESLNLIELESANASSSETLGNSLAENPFINSEKIVDALRTTLDPGFIQAQTEGFLDGAYGWLNNETEIPQFTFSLAEKQSELEARLGESLISEFSSMPECPPEEITPDFNLIEALCRPPGVDIEQEVNTFIQDLAGQDGLLARATWTGEDLVQTANNDSGLNQNDVKNIKNAFGGLKDGPLVFLIAGFVSIPLVFISSRNFYRGFSEVGTTLFSGSLFTFVPAIIIARWENVITSLIGETGDNTSAIKAARNIFEPFLETAVGDVARLTAAMSGVVLGLSALMVLYSLYLRKKYKVAEENEAQHQIDSARQDRKLKEVKKKARPKNLKFQQLTVDPKTKKPLKEKKQAITVHAARKIARDPSTKKKKVSDIEQETVKAKSKK